MSHFIAFLNEHFIYFFNSLEYQNEARNDAPDKEDGDKSDSKTIVFSTHATHCITLDDITFYSEEFRIGNERGKKEQKNASPRSRHASSKTDESNDDDEDNVQSLDPFASAISSFSPDNEMFYTQSSRLIESQTKERHNDESDDEDNEEIINRSEMILMGCLNGRQEIRINMKLAENIEGPKVSLEVMFGTILLFFTPRQFHMLLLLCDILLNGDTLNSNSSGDDNGDNKRKMMKEEEKKPRYGGGLMAHQTWSGGDQDYDCSSDVASAKYYGGATFRPVGSDSILSSNSSMTSSMQSSASQYTSHSQRHKRAIERDQNAEISHFNVRVAGIYALLLHDDVLLATTDEKHPLNESTVEKLRYKCEYFFNYVGKHLNTCSSSDVVKIGAILKKACDNNHLR